MYVCMYFDHMPTWQVESSQTKDQAALWDDMGGVSHYIPRLWRPVGTSSVTSQTIVQNKGRKKWHAKSWREAQVLLHQIKSLFSLLPPTLPSIFLDSHLGLSLSLQGSTLDVIEAYKHVKVVRDQLKVFCTLLTAVINFSHSVFFLLFLIAIKLDM